MLRHLRTIVTTWPFLLSLVVLLANDAWFKSAYPGLVTGKLSDVAGIAIVSLLLLAAWPQRRGWVYAGVALGFAWWKSALSQPAIDALNLLLANPIGRTVDLSDLVALLVMPACAAVVARPRAFALPGETLRRLLVVPAVTLTLLGLMATSALSPRYNYQIRRTDAAADLDREAVAQVVAQVAEQHGLRCEDCSKRSIGAKYSDDKLFLSYSFVSATAISFEVFAYRMNPLPFFGDSNANRADRLRDHLKWRLAAAFKDLEYVETLGPGPRGIR